MFKQRGDAVKADEPLVELETDKVTLEVNAPEPGVLSEISVQTGETVAIGAFAGRAVADGSDRAGEGRGERLRRQGGCVERGRRRPRRRRNSPRKAASMSAPWRASGKRGQVLKGDVLQEIAKSEAPKPDGAKPESAAPAPAPPAISPSPVPIAPFALRAPAAAGRRRARGARASDQVAPDHRAPAQGRAEHRRDADDLQRGRHDRNHRDARPLQGAVREEARRQARLHGFFRQGVRAGAEGRAGGQRRRSTAPISFSRTIITSASPSAPTRGSSCRSCATPTGSPSPRSRRRSPATASARAKDN